MLFTYANVVAIGKFFGCRCQNSWSVLLVFLFFLVCLSIFHDNLEAPIYWNRKIDVDNCNWAVSASASVTVAIVKLKPISNNNEIIKTIYYRNSETNWHWQRINSAFDYDEWPFNVSQSEQYRNKIKLDVNLWVNVLCNVRHRPGHLFSGIWRRSGISIIYIK